MTRVLPRVEGAVAAALRALPDVRGKATVALGWKRLRERRGPLDGGWRLPLADGSQAVLPRGSAMTWAVAATGGWDRHVIDRLTGYIAPATVALDVGASIGLWTLPLARAAGARGARIWCFEPNPDNIAWLRANIEANGLAPVTEIRAVALGARAGTARLGAREPGGGNGALLDPGTVDAVDVPVVRLDDVGFPARVSFVKMDVEGFELEVLRGARALIARDRPAIFGEFNADWLRRRGEDVAGELAAIVALGYDVFQVEERRSASWRPKDLTRLRRLDALSASGAENLLLLPGA